jgi:tight adherence protein B
MAQYLLPVAIFATVFFGLAGGVLLLTARAQEGRLRQRLQEMTLAGSQAVTLQDNNAFSLLAEAGASFGAPPVDRVLRSWPLIDRIALGLVQADMKLRVAEWLLIRLGIGLAFGALAFAISHYWPVGVIVGVVGYIAPRYYVTRRATARTNKFVEQLPDSLSLLANSLRSGFGLLQVIQDLSRELAPPISDELAAVAHEMSLGGDLEVALTHLQTRVRSYDLDLIVTAMLVQRKVGGNLSEVLDSIAHTIRERVRILGEVRALTAEVRLSGNILTLLPVFTALAISVLSPTYLVPMFTTTPGRIMTVVGLIVMLVSFYMLRKLGTIEV